MFKFLCKKCKRTKKLSKSILEIFEGKVRKKNAECKCGNYMSEVSKPTKGFPNLIRTEPTLTKK
tara:strand:- start:1234 stop:1425 length:192 start_codon:yes stop_codon:yes gene_type:complete